MACVVLQHAGVVAIYPYRTFRYLARAWQQEVDTLLQKLIGRMQVCICGIRRAWSSQQRSGPE